MDDVEVQGWLFQDEQEAFLQSRVTMRRLAKTRKALFDVLVQVDGSHRQWLDWQRAGAEMIPLHHFVRPRLAEIIVVDSPKAGSLVAEWLFSTNDRAGFISPEGLDRVNPSSSSTSPLVISLHGENGQIIRHRAWQIATTFLEVTVVDTKTQRVRIRRSIFSNLVGEGFDFDVEARRPISS